MSVQLADSSLESDPVAAKTLLQEIGRDVQKALEEAAHLAHRIHAPLLEVGGFGPALRFAAVSAGVPASVEVSTGSTDYPPEILQTVYSCWLDTLQHRRGATPAAIAVREQAGALTFEIGPEADWPEPRLDSLRDRVEALGGRLRVESRSGDGIRVRGSLPLSR